MTEKELELKNKARAFADKLLPNAKGDLQEFYKTLVVVAYEEGAEKNDAVWHDLRKDPNDLPKKDCEVVSIHENGNKAILKWKNGGWTCAIMIPIVAWCEIPKFEET